MDSIEEGRAANKSPHYKFGHFLSISQQGVSADLIQNSAVGNFSPPKKSMFLKFFPFLYIFNSLQSSLDRNCVIIKRCNLSCNVIQSRYGTPVCQLYFCRVHSYVFILISFERENYFVNTLGFGCMNKERKKESSLTVYISPSSSACCVPTVVAVIPPPLPRSHTCLITEPVVVRQHVYIVQL